VGSVLTGPVVAADGVSHVLSCVWREPQQELSPVLRDAAVAAATRTARQLLRTAVPVPPVPA
jgi:hypothetical protein